jgi:hypothetical protein
LILTLKSLSINQFKNEGPIFLEENMHNIRKFLIKSLTVLVLFLVAGTAFASNGDTINIGGSVPLILTLTVAPTAVADNLPLTKTGADAASTQILSTISVVTNNTAGWELWVFSANDGTMDNADTDSLAYTLTYAGTGGVGPVAPATAGVKYGELAGASTGDTGENLSITYTQSATHPAGYYSDQLTIVLRAK